MPEAQAKRRFQFSIRSLFAATALVAALLYIGVLMFRLPTKIISGESVRRAHTIRLNDQKQDIYAVYIEVIGNLDGAATITFPSSEKVIKIGPGSFETSDTIECIDNFSDLEYTPDNVRSGHVYIRYRIEGIFW